MYGFPRVYPHEDIHEVEIEGPQVVGRAPSSRGPQAKLWSCQHCGALQAAHLVVVECSIAGCTVHSRTVHNRQCWSIFHNWQCALVASPCSSGWIVQCAVLGHRQVIRWASGARWWGRGGTSKLWMWLASTAIGRVSQSKHLKARSGPRVSNFFVSSKDLSFFLFRDTFRIEWQNPWIRKVSRNNKIPWNNYFSTIEL